MKRLTKKLKDISVLITFAESKEYDTVKKGAGIEKSIKKISQKLGKVERPREKMNVIRTVEFPRKTFRSVNKGSSYKN
jgi:hypothetical protein